MNQWIENLFLCLSLPFKETEKKNENTRRTHGIGLGRHRIFRRGCGHEGRPGVKVEEMLQSPGVQAEGQQGLAEGTVDGAATGRIRSKALATEWV